MTWWNNVDFSKMKVTHRVLSMDDTYTVQIEMDPDTLDLIMPIPEEVLQKMGWGLNDVLEWIDNMDGSWTLRKVDEKHSPYYYDTERNK